MMQDEQRPHFKKTYEFFIVVTYDVARTPTATASTAHMKLIALNSSRLQNEPRCDSLVLCNILWLD